MCDGNQPPVRAARAVSVKELSRGVAAVIKEVEFDGHVVVVSRRGTMVALVTPLPERTVVEFRSEPRTTDDDLEEVIEDPASIPVLEPLAKKLLAAALAAHPMPVALGGFAYDESCGASAAAVAFGQLELEGFIENGMRGRRLTREGLKVARWLDSRDEAPS